MYSGDTNESESKKDLKKETLKIMILYPIYCLIIAIFFYYGITFLFGMKSAPFIVVVMVGIFSTIIVLDLNFKIKAIYYLIYEHLKEKEK